MTLIFGKAHKASIMSVSVKLFALILLILNATTALLVRPAPLQRQRRAPAIMIAATPTSDDALAPEASCVEDEAVEECVVLQWPAGKVAVSRSIADAAQLGFLLFLWFSLNIGYNITLKKCTNAFPMPWTLCLTSLAVGLPMCTFLWATGLRKAPKIDMDGWKTLAPIGALHALGHAGAVISIGAGAVSFAHTVKAAEPVFTCVLSYLVMGTVFKWQVYASLTPIMVGVAISSLKELSFTMTSLYGALLSNVAFAGRAVLSKATMAKPVGEHMTPANLYGVLTFLAFAMTLPVTLFYEGATMGTAWATATSKVGAAWLTRQIVLNGAYFYAYNEIAFKTLNKVSPVTHSICNTVKRTAIILATVLVFGNVLTPMGALGSTIAILGTFVYSTAKVRYS